MMIGNRDGVVDRLEVQIKPFLVRLIIVGRDDEEPVGAGAFRMAGDGDRLAGIVRARAGDDRRARPRAARIVSVMTRPCSSWLSVGLLARRADGHEAMRSTFNLPIDQRAQCVIIDLSMGKRRDQGRHRPMKNRLYAHRIQSFPYASEPP